MISAVAVVTAAVWKLVTAFRAVGIAAAIAEALATGGVSVAAALAGAAAAAVVAYAAFSLLDRMAPDLSKEITQARGIGGSIGRDADELDASLREKKAAGDASVSESPGGFDLGKGGVGNMLKDIVKNTRITAQNTDFLNPQRFALGGGDLGRSGLEYSESQRINRTPTIKITGGGTEFGRLIQEHIVDALKQLSQQGYELKRTRA